MIKQEEIREGIKEALEFAYKQDPNDDSGSISFGDFWSGQLIKKLHSQGVVIKVKCPDCAWSQFKGIEVVGMTPCLTCNSTGYIIEPLINEN